MKLIDDDKYHRFLNAFKKQWNETEEKRNDG